MNRSVGSCGPATIPGRTIVADSPYVTSGKVFEYMSTGKPILGLYQPDCAVAEVLDGYPLLVRTRSLDPEDVASSAAGLPVDVERAQLRRRDVEGAERPALDTVVVLRRR